MQHTPLRLPIPMRIELDRISQARNIRRTELIRELIAQGLEKQNTQTKNHEAKIAA